VRYPQGKIKEAILHPDMEIRDRRPIFRRLIQEKLGLSSAQERIADRL
jgi:hypothetical protein